MDFDAAKFIRGQMEEQMGLTPVEIVNGHTIPQLIALMESAPDSPLTDPFLPKPGERVITAGELEKIIARRKAKEKGHAP